MRGLHRPPNDRRRILNEESELDFLFDVNVYGPYRITREFAPLLIRKRGRT